MSIWNRILGRPQRSNAAADPNADQNYADQNENARIDDRIREYNEREAAKERLAQKEFGPPINDLSQQVVTAMENVVSGKFITDFVDQIPSFPGPLEAIQLGEQFAATQLRNGFYRAADNVKGLFRRTPEATEIEAPNLPSKQQLAKNDPANKGSGLA